jgi:membrane protein DedA with SNARE-associated domain
MIYTILGCLIWNGGFIFLGLLLGSNWPVVKEYSSIIEYSVLAVLIVGIFVLIWRRWRTYKQA